MKHTLPFVCAALLLLFALPVPAAPKPSPAAASVLEPANLDRFYRDQMQRQGLVGLSLVVMQDGRVTATRCYGMASRQTRQPVTPNTEFAVGSITKQFTAACLLLLAEDGRLSVHDPVSKYYLTLTRASNITLLDLLNHVSGYPDYYPLDFLDARMTRPTPVDAVIRKYAGMPLDFAPGTRWSYSNTGYLILGRIVERVSGQPLAKFMQTRLFAPLGMTHTRCGPPAPGLAQGYIRFALSGPMKALREADGWAAAAGALSSTPSDLAKWDLALMSGRVLTPKSLAVMTTPRILQNGASTQYGAGLFVGARQGRTVWVHTGEVSGFEAENWMLPSRRSAVIVTLNTGYGDLSPLVRHVGLALLAAAPASTPTPPAARIAASPIAAAPSSPIPAVHGPAAEAVARHMVAALEQGAVDRTTLGADYSAYLNPTLLRAGAQSLRGWGTPRAIQTQNTSERGGMEVSEFLLTFGKGALSATLFRTPDGKVQEFLLAPAP